MASQYDNIKTAKDLIIEVKMHGLSTLQDDICRAQDIFGNSSVGELELLANDNGRTNDKGEKDPDGTWSSGRDGTQKVFYQIIFTIWGWERATEYWNQNSNPEFRRLRKAEKYLDQQVKNLTEDIAQMKKSLDVKREECEELKVDVGNLTALKQKHKAELGQVKYQNLVLKAKMYDLMVEKTAEEHT